MTILAGCSAYQVALNLPAAFVGAGGFIRSG
jgi:hypothetical protein